MKYHEYPPPSCLAPFIKCYWSLSDSCREKSENPKPFLTEGGIELVFNLGSLFAVTNDQSVFKNDAGAFVIGPMTKAKGGYASGACHLFGVCFQPGGAMPFLSIPPVELADRCLGEEDLRASMPDDLADRLRDHSGDVQAMTGILNRFFAPRIDCLKAEFQLLSFSMKMIRKTGGRMPVDLMARRLAISRRRLERIFQKLVGISPKKVARLFRIKNAIHRMMDSSFAGWPELAMDAGYFDQAHFIRDLKLMTGLTPSSCKDFRNDLTMLT